MRDLMIGGEHDRRIQEREQAQQDMKIASPTGRRSPDGKKTVAPGGEVPGIYDLKERKTKLDETKAIDDEENRFRDVRNERDVYFCFRIEEQVQVFNAVHSIPLWNQWY